jgi:hypothetical protein
VAVKDDQKGLPNPSSKLIKRRLLRSQVQSIAREITAMMRRERHLLRYERSLTLIFLRTATQVKMRDSLIIESEATTQST